MPRIKALILVRKLLSAYSGFLLLWLFDFLCSAVQTYMTSQTSILAQSVLSHILPAIQEALAPAPSTNNASAKPAGDVTALPTTPVNRKTSGVTQEPSPDVAAKSLLQPSLMEASPSHPRSSDVNMVMNPDFASLANNSVKYELCLLPITSADYLH